MHAPQITKGLVIEMALAFLPNDGTDWLPRLHKAHLEISKSWLIGDAANVPAKVALHAFESMGYQYMEVENGPWRRSLGSIASRHWTLNRQASTATDLTHESTASDRDQKSPGDRDGS